MIGAHPNTDWLPAELRAGDGGFVRTGADVESDGSWPLERSPLSLETSMPGVFAAGDVRHGSMNRVASAVGEGSIAIKLVHELFAAERPRDGDHHRDAVKNSLRDAVVAQDDLVAAVLLVAAVFAALLVLRRELLERIDRHLDPLLPMNCVTSGIGNAALVRVRPGRSA